MRFLILLALALFILALNCAPASAQCRNGACRAQFGRVQSRRESRPVLSRLGKLLPRNR